MKTIALGFTMLLLSHLTGGPAAHTTAEEELKQRTIEVSLIGSNGQSIGKAWLAQHNKQVSIKVEAEKLPPGELAIHIHETGKCEAPGFESAGAHFNPTHKQHGFDNPHGFHEGDLPNIRVGPDGKAAARLATAVVTLKPGQPNSLLKEGGTALVIHERADDYKTDPSGNSGKRIACGVIQ